MPDSKLPKPSLTQRRKISGSSSAPEPMSSMPSPTDSLMSKLKPPKLSSKIGGMDSDMPKDPTESDDVSLVKIGLVIVAVIVVAVIAGFLIVNLQKSGDENSNDDQTSEDTNDDVDVTETPTPTPTEEPTTTPTATLTPTPTPDSETPNTDNEFSQSEQSISTSASGQSIKIRTYQYENMPTFYEFNLPVEAVSGSENVPNATASYNSDGDLELTVENISQFLSCSYLNDNNSNMAYGNVVKVSCAKVGTDYVFTIDTTTKTDFKLFAEERKIKTNGETVDAVVIQVNNK